MAEKKQRKNTGKKEKAKKIEKKIEKKGRIEEKPPVQAGFLKTYQRPLVFLSIFALSLIFLVSNLGMAGIVGKWLKSLNFGLFGFFAWLMPLYVVLITALLLLGEKEWKMKLRIFLSFFVLHFFMAIGKEKEKKE